MAFAMAFPGSPPATPGNDMARGLQSRSSTRCGTSSGRPPSGAGLAGTSVGDKSCPKVLPLRADVLLSNSLFEELDDGISADFLRRHTGKTDLEEVDFLEMQVDTVSGAQQAECLGQFMPNLQQMRLNESAICTIRDLGTNYKHLRVLWLNRSALQDLGGITVMPALEELYISFNDVRDLSPLYAHDSLQVLDVEGNMIEDFEEVENLQTLASLRELTINSNPVCKSNSFSRDAVLNALPQLEVLDDVRRGEDPPDGLEVLELGEDAFDAAILNELRDEALTLGNEMGLDDLLNDAMEAPAFDKESQSLSKLRRLRSQDDDANLQAVAAESTNDLEAEYEDSAAVVELRKRRAGIREDAACLETPKNQDVDGEPSEQDLVVENLKRARKPVPSVWAMQAPMTSSHADKQRPYTGFFPDRRGLRTAWSNSGSSTTYRPPSSSVGSFSTAKTSSTAAHSAEPDDVDPNSELTMGDEGSALAGNPLSAVRRRRKVAKEKGSDEHNIREMLRRFETFNQESCLTEAELEHRRRQSETKRPGTSDVRVSAARLLTSSGRPGPLVSRPGAPGESWVAPARRETPARRGTPAGRPSSRKGSDLADGDFTAPTFSTEAGEALVID